MSMNAKTRKTMIGVCVVGFLLTSTYTWNLLTGAFDLAIKGVEGGQVLAQGSVAWILAHVNAVVPLIFLGVVIWLIKQKSGDDS